MDHNCSSQLLVSSHSLFRRLMRMLVAGKGDVSVSGMRRVRNTVQQMCTLLGVGLPDLAPLSMQMALSPGTRSDQVHKDFSSFLGQASMDPLLVTQMEVLESGVQLCVGKG